MLQSPLQLLAGISVTMLKRSTAIWENAKRGAHEGAMHPQTHERLGNNTNNTKTHQQWMIDVLIIKLVLLFTNYHPSIMT